MDINPLHPLFAAPRHPFDRNRYKRDRRRTTINEYG